MGSSGRMLPSRCRTRQTRWPDGWGWRARDAPHVVDGSRPRSPKVIPAPITLSRAGRNANSRSGRPCAGSRAGRRAFGRAHALQAKLALAPDHEQSGGGDDGGAEEDEDGRQLAEEEIAEQEGPDHRRVVER